MRAKNSTASVFMLAGTAFALLFGLVGLVIHTAYADKKTFDAECSVLHGEVARQGRYLICVDPKHVLKTQRLNDSGHHGHSH